MTPPRSTAPLVVVALVAPLAACGALALLRDQVSPADAALVLVLVVVAVAATGRRLAGVVAAVSSAAWFDVLLTRPYGHLTIADRDDVVTAVLLTVVGLAVTELALWGRRQQAGASRREGYLDGLVTTAALVAAGDAPGAAVVDVVAQQVREVLGVDSCTFSAGPPGPHPRLQRDGSITRRDKTIDVDRSGLPSDDVVELPVESGGVVHGRFVLHAAARVVWPTLEQRRVAVTLAEQAGAALLIRPSGPPTRQDA